MYLKNITINNYKSIQKATVSFEPGLNILIGKNGAGKSNMLQFIYDFVVYYTVSGRLLKNFAFEYQFSICYEDNDALNELVIYLKREKKIPNGKIEYSNEYNISEIKNGVYIYKDIAITVKGDDIKNNNEFQSFLNKIHIFQSFNRAFVPFQIPYNPYWLSQPNKFEIDNELYPTSEDYYDGFDIIYDLTNMVEVHFLAREYLKFEDIDLDNIKLLISDAFLNFNEKYQLNLYLSKYSPIQEIRMNPNINVYKTKDKILVENLLIDFKVNDDWIPWSYLSDGTKRLFYIITECLALHQGLLLIEEPELGIHPHQLYALMEFIKEQSRDKQIIISTHSPIVLDVLPPDELNRINIVKLTTEGTQCYKLTEEQIETAQEYMRETDYLSNFWLHSDLEDE